MDNIARSVEGWEGDPTSHHPETHQPWWCHGIKYYPGSKVVLSKLKACEDSSSYSEYMKAIFYAIREISPQGRRAKLKTSKLGWYYLLEFLCQLEFFFFK